ncbi:MAG TPA: AAA family ATPase [Rudaea sp.]|jgi:general secretion pathway protein A|uniref:AAA family ATPase n=1 Tax=Rudaea sp. TaxID=2136325 RepID=UPI002F946743
MYLEFYGLREAPFSITPDPRYVFLSERHRDALAHLLYGVGKGGGGGFVQLTGEVGTGKTTLCRLLLEQLPENTRVALVLNPKLSPIELLESICDELHLSIADKKGSLKGLVDTLNAYLLDAYAQGLRVVLIVDEAQNLSTESLEQIRLLTNLETPTQKLLQIILLGQPELREKLNDTELRQLAQRITARYHLTPLDRDETEAYARHRLAVAGSARSPFSRLALRALYKRSGGVPRLINVIGDRALMAGYAREQGTIGERLIDRAADETLPGTTRYWLYRYGRWAAAALVVLGLATVTGGYLAQRQSAEQAALVAAAAAKAAAPVAPKPDPGKIAEQRLLAALKRNPDSELAAWTQLLSRWQVNSSDISVRDATRCQPVVFPGLDCLRGHATIEQLARFDRPLILLLAKDDVRGYALLQGAAGDQVRLDFAGESLALDKARLGEVWNGEFIALWRLPEAVPARLHNGDAGAGVAWIKTQLARMDGKAADAGPAFFDATLDERVRKLQSAYGIKPDAIVGPETLFALSALDPAGPHLARTLQ